jgi:hypothetical protein
MPHVRKQIRDAVAAALADLPTTGDRVFSSKRYNWRGDELPGLAIYTDSEQVERLNMQRGQRRTVSLVIDLAESANDEDTLDAMASEVETALAADVTFGGPAKDSSLAGTDTDTSTDGEKPVGIKRLRYTVTYHTHHGQPDTAA